MPEEERKARNMREGVGIKDWIAQGKDRSTHSHQGKKTACSSIGLATARQQTWPNGNGTRVNYWTREVEKQNTRYRDRSIEIFVSSKDLSKLFILIVT